uniref:Uncharacterized protein n=1 Tax=Arundo donax TaxID=35708 RepID=A0A0A9FC34_ARUDO
MLHSLAHTESWAVDLSWDIVARFGAPMRMPREFFDDFTRVAQDEGRHYTVLSARMRELGSHYGALPAHDGLWDSAMRTSHCLLARLAVEHCVHEARGLDVLPTTISRFRAGGDEQTAKILEDVIYPEEITHCAAGVRWFRYLCLRSRKDDPITCSVPEPQPHGSELPGDGTPDTKTGQGVEDELTSRQTQGVNDNDNTDQGVEDERLSKVAHGINGLDKMVEEVEHGFEKCKLGDNLEEDEAAVIRTFHRIVRKYFRGPLKPPFNKEARKAAGFEPSWYEPLAVKEAYVEGEPVE